MFVATKVGRMTPDIVEADAALREIPVNKVVHVRGSPVTNDGVKGGKLLSKLWGHDHGYLLQAFLLPVRLDLLDRVEHRAFVKGVHDVNEVLFGWDSSN